jgi:hypothetical protein
VGGKFLTKGHRRVISLEILVWAVFGETP